MPLPNWLEGDIRGESILHLNGECSASLVIANMQSWACGEFVPKIVMHRQQRGFHGFRELAQYQERRQREGTNLSKFSEAKQTILLMR